MAGSGGVEKLTRTYAAEAGAIVALPTLSCSTTELILTQDTDRCGVDKYRELELYFYPSAGGRKQMKRKI